MLKGHSTRLVLFILSFIIFSTPYKASTGGGGESTLKVTGKQKAKNRVRKLPNGTPAIKSSDIQSADEIESTTTPPSPDQSGSTKKGITTPIVSEEEAALLDEDTNLRAGNSISDYLSFLYKFITERKTTGAIAPSSQGLAKAITKKIRDFKKNNPRKRLRILEVGPGTGIFTKWILKYIDKNDTLILVELDKHFYKHLKQMFGNYPNVHIYHGSITDFDDKEIFNFVISGVPFNSLPYKVVRAIIKKYISFIEQGATLSFFEYLGACGFNTFIDCSLACIKNPKFLKIRDTVKRLKKYTIGSDTVWQNLPPARAIHLKKKN